MDRLGSVGTLASRITPRFRYPDRSARGCQIRFHQLHRRTYAIFLADRFSQLGSSLPDLWVAHRDPNRLGKAFGSKIATRNWPRRDPQLKRQVCPRFLIENVWDDDRGYPRAECSRCCPRSAMMNSG